MKNWQKRFSIEGKRAVVTGASSGIGLEICRVFADAGVDLIAVGQNELALEALAGEISQSGINFLSVPADLSTVAGCEYAAEKALAHFGTIDILVNSAGVALIDPALNVSQDDWDKTMNVNVRAPFILSQKLAPKMIEQRWGKIINISSQTGVIALENHAAYATSKGALNALTKSLMSEWAQHNIQVNAICPTVVMTEMGKKIWSPPEKSGPMLAKTPLGRFGEPVEIADLALYLASPAAELINGELLMIEGGFSSV